MSKGLIWLIQDTLVDIGNATKTLEAVKQSGTEFGVLKVIPFDTTVSTDSNLKGKTPREILARILPGYP